MANSYNFRSAFNGFNREDVVHYIEYINSNHTNQLNQLRSDLAAAQQERSGDSHSDADDRCAQLESRCAQLEAQLEAMTAERDEALKSAASQTSSVKLSGYTDDELTAYRRAERVEREAKERADLVYAQIQQMLADATAKAEEAASQLSGTSDKLAMQLDNLQKIVSSSKQALHDAAASLEINK